MNADKLDAARYRWLRDAKEMTLCNANPRYWVNQDGSKSLTNCLLVANGVQYIPKRTMDETIDAAMDTK